MGVIILKNDKFVCDIWRTLADISGKFMIMVLNIIDEITLVSIHVNGPNNEMPQIYDHFSDNDKMVICGDWDFNFI